MIIIDKEPNKGLLFEPNTGSTLGHPVGFSSVQNFYHRKFIQPLDGFITNPATQWLQHTVGFPFLLLQSSRILSTDSHPATDRDCRSPHIVGFFFFTTNHTNLNGSTRWGCPFRPPPMGKITSAHSPRTGVNSSKTYPRV